MNKNTTITLTIGAIIILLGGGYFFLNSRSNPQPVSTSPTASNTQAQPPAKQKQSLKRLFELADNQQCSFKDDESKNTGTIFAHSGKARGDFQSQNNGTAIKSHMISDGQSVHVWMDGEKQGFKTSLDSMASTPEQTKTKSVDVNKQVDFSCRPWKVDESIFTPPADIEFQDVNSMMQDTQTMMKDNTNDTMMQKDNTQACIQCDSLPEEAQTQCKTLLKCP
jgi:hypothetical protein